MMMVLNEEEQLIPANEALESMESMAGILPNAVLQHFDAYGILAVTGVNDPALYEKIDDPHAFGWATRQELTLTTTTGSLWRGFRRYRLIPREVGAGYQSVMVSDTGDVFLETVGEWGVIYMHRGNDGRVSTRHQEFPKSA